MKRTRFYKRLQHKTLTSNFKTMYCNSKEFNRIETLYLGKCIYWALFFNFWWQQLAAGRSLNCASCRGGWGERSCPSSATAIHSVAVDRTTNLPIERLTLDHWAIVAPSSFLTRYIDLLSLALQKYLLWLSLEFTTTVLCPTAQPTAVLPVYQPPNWDTCTTILFVT